MNKYISKYVVIMKQVRPHCDERNTSCWTRVALALSALPVYRLKIAL